MKPGVVQAILWTLAAWGLACWFIAICVRAASEPPPRRPAHALCRPGIP